MLGGFPLLLSDNGVCLGARWRLRQCRRGWRRGSVVARHLARIGFLQPTQESIMRFVVIFDDSPDMVAVRSWTRSPSAS
jgi:hypothetical protein